MYIPRHVLGYLESNYIPSMTGKELAEQLDLAGRSARRYLENYRKQLGKFAAPERHKAPYESLDAVVFDIETSDFGTEGYAGRLLCCSFLNLRTSKVHTVEAKFKEHNDRRLLREVAAELARYNYHIGHNIATYDYNWLNSRLMFHGLPTLDSAYYFDTYQVARSLALKTRKGLGNLIDYFGLEGIKTTIYRTSWSGALSPYQGEFEAAMKDIVFHCEQDVVGNRAVFNPLHHYALNNGRVNPWKLSKMRGNYWKQHDVMEKTY